MTAAIVAQMVRHGTGGGRHDTAGAVLRPGGSAAIAGTYPGAVCAAHFGAHHRPGANPGPCPEGYDAAAMGQPVTVVEKPSSRPGLVRFEINRSLTGMGHERYTSRADAEGDRPPDELARRLFDRGGIDAVHINSSVITVDLAKGASSDGLADLIRELFRYYN
ncbi:hypothetical protein BH18ACT4_BH18ACT4_10840 [soil metagenome]